MCCCGLVCMILQLTSPTNHCLIVYLSICIANCYLEKIINVNNTMCSVVNIMCTVRKTQIWTVRETAKWTTTYSVYAEVFSSALAMLLAVNVMLS